MIFDDILDFIFPSACIGCAASLSRGTVLCAPCLQKIPRHRTLFCAVCLARLPDSKKICHKEAPYLFGAAADYAPPVRDLIHALKFKFVRNASVPLAELLIGYVRSFPKELFGDALVIPVPLSADRERSRGFNQSQLIALVMARALNLEVSLNHLERIKHTAPQSDRVSAAERRINVSDAFRTTHPEALLGKTVLLIDDVRTTGATLAEAAVTLKCAGVKRIFGIVAARA